jgi:hypothetical protein
VVLRSQDWQKSTPKMAAWERLIQHQPTLPPTHTSVETRPTMVNDVGATCLASFEQNFIFYINMDNILLLITYFWLIYFISGSVPKPRVYVLFVKTNFRISSQCRLFIVLRRCDILRQEVFSSLSISLSSGVLSGWTELSKEKQNFTWIRIWLGLENRPLI